MTQRALGEQALAVQEVDSAIQRKKNIIQRIVQLVFVIFIRWIAVYQVNSSIQLSRNQNLT